MVLTNTWIINAGQPFIGMLGVEVVNRYYIRTFNSANIGKNAKSISLGISRNSFMMVFIMLSGDIHINPGPRQKCTV